MIKTVLKTVVVTSVVLGIVFSVFLKGILGMFGLAYTSLETLTQLRGSQQIVETMKKRNKIKKSKAPKKFVRKAGARVATSAVAAATIGTAAVTLTVFGLEIQDYCEEKEQLLEDENLLYGSNETFDYKKCLSEAQNDSKQILTEAKDSMSESVKESWESTSDFTEEKWEEFLQSSSIAMTDLKAATSDLFDSWRTWFNWF